MGYLKLGKKTQTNEEFLFPMSLMKRHLYVMGSTGSGKTYGLIKIIEEAAKNNTPCMIFDSQGDITSLSSLSGNQHFENCEIIVWSPASTKANMLSINPLSTKYLKKMSGEEREHFYISRAMNMIDLISIRKNDTTKIRCMVTLLTNIFKHCYINTISLNSLEDLIKALNNYPQKLKDKLISKRIFKSKLLDELIREIALLTEGPQRLMFKGGTSATIENLLGIENDSGKTRISVIYLNTLSSESQKNFYVNSIGQLFYEYMLANPPSDPDTIRGAMILDEAGQFVPPVKKTSCKSTIITLFKQARKYGFSMIISSQNPSDIDYKIYAQVNTFIIGKINTSQDIRNLKMRIMSSGVDNIEHITQRMSRLSNGKFMIISTELDPALNDILFDLPQSKINIYSQQDLAGLKQLKFTKEVLEEEVDISNCQTNIQPSEVPSFVTPIDSDKDTLETSDGRVRQNGSIEKDFETDEYREVKLEEEMEISNCETNIQPSELPSLTTSIDSDKGTLESSVEKEEQSGFIIKDYETNDLKEVEIVKNKIINCENKGDLKKEDGNISLSENKQNVNHLKPQINNESLCITANIKQSELSIYCRKYLKGLIWTAEKIDNEMSVLNYYPLLKISVSKDTDLRKKREFHLMLDPSSFELISIQSGILSFDKLPKMNISLLIDFFTKIHFKISKYKISSDLVFPDYNINQLRETIANKYRLNILNIEECYYPYWKCNVTRNKKNERTFNIDAVHGLKFNFNERGYDELACS